MLFLKTARRKSQASIRFHICVDLKQLLPKPKPKVESRGVLYCSKTNILKLTEKKTTQLYKDYKEYFTAQKPTTVKPQIVKLTEKKTTQSGPKKPSLKKLEKKTDPAHFSPNCTDPARVNKKVKRES